MGLLKLGQGLGLSSLIGLTNSKVMVGHKLEAELLTSSSSDLQVATLLYNDYWYHGVFSIMTNDYYRVSSILDFLLDRPSLY